MTKVLWIRGREHHIWPFATTVTKSRRLYFCVFEARLGALLKNRVCTNRWCDLISTAFIANRVWLRPPTSETCRLSSAPLTHCDPHGDVSLILQAARTRSRKYRLTMHYIQSMHYIQFRAGQTDRGSIGGSIIGRVVSRSFE